MTEELIKKENILFQDEQIMVVLPERPATPGHLIVMPKEKKPILEAIPDFMIGHMTGIANKLSIALFEGLQASGTNIIIQNGVAAGQTLPHVQMHVIPRRQDDKLPLDWEPKQIPPDQLGDLEQKIKKECDSIGPFQLEEKKPIEMGKDVEKIEEGEQVNYLIKQLQRIP